MSKKEQDHADLMSLFEEFEMNTQDSRALALRDRDYYDNKQWTAAEEEILRRRKQPVVTINRIKPKIDFLMGMEQQSRSDPKVVARTPEHEQDAAFVTDILSYLDHKNNFDDVKSQAFKDYAVEGIATGKIEVSAITGRDGKVKDFNIGIKQLHFDRIFFDPHSRQPDFKDARYKGEVIFMDADEAKALFPKKEAIIDAAFMDEGIGSLDSFTDEPSIKWVDSKRNRIRVVEIWYKKGHEIHTAIFTRGGFIKDPKRTPYKNDMGLDEDPYIFRSAFTDREGNRYGYVRQLISIQDEINKRRSKALHMMSVRQTRFSRNSEADTGKVRKELARPDGIIRAEADEFEILPTGDMAQAQFSLLADAQNQIDTVGTNASLSGKQDGASSGRALQARTAGGSVEIGPIFDGMRMWQREVFTKAWNRVREFWTEEKYIRVTDDNEAARYILLNREDNFSTSNIPQNVSITEIQTPLAELDVDITIREGVNDQMAQQEQFIELTRMAASGVDIPVEFILELSNIRPNLKEKMLQRLRPDPEQQAQQAQIQEHEMMLAFEKEEAKIQDTQTNAAKKQAQAEGIQLDNMIKQIKPIEDV